MDGPNTMSNEPVGDARKVEPLSEILRFNGGEIIPHGCKAHAVKYGMMQQLLTGKIRLVEPVELGDEPPTT